MPKETRSYPLHWPAGRPRTAAPKSAAFDTRFSAARDALLSELKRLGATLPIISTNIPLRLDGLPYAQYRRLEDPGVAVYFIYEGEQHCFACDLWNRAEDNLQAIRKTVAALRGIARWGTGDMLRRAFSGFAQLPGPDSVSVPEWAAVLGIDPQTATLEQAEKAYRVARRRAHPDAGGSTGLFQKVQDAWAQAVTQLS